ECQSRRDLDLPARLEDGEPRYGQAMISEDLLGQRLVARQGQAARIAPGILLLAQLQVTDHVLVEEWQVVELLDQVEDNVRRAACDSSADDGKIAADTRAGDLMAKLLQG